MIIYVDVLLFINLIIDYLLLSVTQKFAQFNPRFFRKLLAAFVSSLFSLYIFLPPQPTVIEILMRLISSSVTVMICFGFQNARLFLRRLFIFFAASFVYAGLMAGVWMLLKPSLMSINNGIVYFDISPIWLIAASLLFYIAIVLIKKLTGKQAEFAKRCEVTLTFGENTVKAYAMVDSGHSLNDAFSGGTVMIIDKRLSVGLFGENDTDSMMTANVPQSQEVVKRFRLIPANTVTGEKMLPAVRIDSADILNGKQTHRLIKPTAVISNTCISDDCSVIIPPSALNI